MNIKLNPIALEIMKKLGAPIPVNFDPDHNSDHLLELMGAIDINAFFIDRNACAIPGEDLGGDEFETSVPIESGPNARRIAMKEAIFRLLEKLLPTL